MEKLTENEEMELLELLEQEELERMYFEKKQPKESDNIFSEQSMKIKNEYLN